MPCVNAPNTQNLFSMIGLVIGCVLFGLGSLIVAHVDGVGAYAMAFWRLSVSALIFLSLALIFRQPFPSSRREVILALISGGALGLDLGLWHESIYAVGPGISTLLNSLQIFFLAFIAFLGLAKNRPNYNCLAWYLRRLAWHSSQALSLPTTRPLCGVLCRGFCQGCFWRCPCPLSDARMKWQMWRFFP